MLDTPGDVQMREPPEGEAQAKPPVQEARISPPNQIQKSRGEEIESRVDSD